MPRNVVLRVQDLRKSYGDIRALAGVSFDVFEGEFFGIIGPSGSGKSTILRLFASVEPPTEGRILYHGEDLTLSTSLSRNLVMVWQSLALFPHMDVGRNVAFGLSVRRISREEGKGRIKEVLAMVGLGNYEKRRVHELSGGEQQRVALARALVVHPKVLLLDEPLGALDARLRGQLQARLRHLHKTTGLTFIMVTHDQSEAFALCNRIAIINNGRIEQVGTPDEIVRSPQTPFVASFVGDKNVFEGILETTTDEGYTVKTTEGTFLAAQSRNSHSLLRSGAKVAYVIDASDVRFGEVFVNVVRGTHQGTIVRGSLQLVRIELASGREIVCEIPRNVCSSLDASDGMTISWRADDAYIISMPEESDSSLRLAAR